MPKQKNVYSKRTFINDDKSMSGFIIATVDEFRHHNDRDKVSSYPSLDIADCSTKISLDFSFYDEPQMKKALKKVRLIKNIINGFADAFESEVKRYEARPKFGKRPKNKKKITELANKIEELEQELEDEIDSN